MLLKWPYSENMRHVGDEEICEALDVTSWSVLYLSGTYFFRWLYEIVGFIYKTSHLIIGVPVEVRSGANMNKNVISSDIFNLRRKEPL